MARRPIFKNEVLGAINGDYQPQYDIVAENGGLTGAKFSLKNVITTQGTPQNADNMNNLFDFDNLGSMQGNTLTVTFLADSITEEIRISGDFAVNARRVTTFPTPTAIIEKTTIYNDEGTIVLRETTVTTTFGTTITEAIS